MKWLEIESAPKDGTRILASRLDDMNDPEVIFWVRETPGYWQPQGCDLEAVNWWSHIPPTHWMPLPDPPTTLKVVG